PVMGVVGVVGARRILDATLFHDSGKQGDFFRAAAEADTGHADLGMRIVAKPLLGLIDELPVHLLGTFIHGVAGHVIPHPCKKSVLLRAGTRDITETSLGIIAGFELLDELPYV